MIMCPIFVVLWRLFRIPCNTEMFLKIKKGNFTVFYIIFYKTTWFYNVSLSARTHIQNKRVIKNQIQITTVISLDQDLLATW